MQRWRRYVAVAGVTLVASYTGLVLVAFIGQRAILYSMPSGAREPSLTGGTLVRIADAGSEPVYALHLPAPPGAPTVVHFHGNGEQLADLTWLASRFREAGLGFYAVEYPGYGLAAGQKPTETALYAAAERAVRHLTSALHAPPHLVVLEGQSLGCAIAVEMARRGLGARLAIVSPFTSIAEIGARALPILPGSFLVLDRYDNQAKAPALTLPALVIHGTADELIPVEMGQKVGALIPGAKVLLVERAGHNDILDRPGVVEALIDFSRDASPEAASP